MSTYQSMKIYILRHGDRGMGYGDMPLSQTGQQQALDIAQNATFQDVSLILCSPKIRTQQTVQPLHEHLGIPLQIAADLDQRRSIETEAEFAGRVLRFFDECLETHQEKTLLLCSHSDWLQTALMNLPLPQAKAAGLSFFSCGDYRTLTYENKIWDIQ